MVNFQSKVALISSILFFSGCSSSPTPSKQPVNQTSTTTLSQHDLKIQQSFLKVHHRWEGVPYRLGGTSFNGIDCSAFVQVAYRDALNVNLPRTTLQQSKIGSSVKYNDAAAGDLVFFKTSRTTRHVGVYLGNKQFLHASTSRGVIISRVDNPYWASKFWHFRRVQSPPTFN
ncbi:NlpC/P60 family protein [Vibrio sp. ZSDE26]|uniref:NlpC/P60 family protein n=1 Tax=Vibrio amylolyticus TaxID=2847292 RepID=A0A9X1XN46_9VIBR|nr:NlpC/P60 family protein [Vibrio amylolyticus]MCK6264963.1 NlpC/P60 family protein [Vibrio amylolyticus]